MEASITCFAATPWGVGAIAQTTAPQHFYSDKPFLRALWYNVTLLS
jgi:hypothetical protein